VVQFSLTEEEFEEVSRAAERSVLARGAFAAEATLALARGAEAKVWSPLREAQNSGGHRGGRAGAAGRDEPEPGGGEAECDRAAR
jgi:hypothetical protein